MPDDLNQVVLDFLGWMFVVSCVGAFIVWRVSLIRADNEARFDQQWQQRFEPNRPNVGERPQWGDDDPTWVDDEYVRLMQALPDDHLPADWRDWGDKAGLRR